jgi:hypothetical protein
MQQSVRTLTTQSLHKRSHFIAPVPWILSVLVDAVRCA